MRPRDLSHVERNLDALVGQLATRCQEVFMEACMAAARSAVLLAPAPPEREPAPPPPPSEDDDPAPLLIRERTVLDEHAPEREVRAFALFLPLPSPSSPFHPSASPRLCSSSPMYSSTSSNPILFFRLHHCVFSAQLR